MGPQPPPLPRHRAADQHRQPPPLPPKPPWLRASLTSAPRPQSYAEASEPSESPEAVIYSRSVRLASGTAARSEVSSEHLYRQCSHHVMHLHCMKDKGYLDARRSNVYISG